MEQHFYSMTNKEIKTSRKFKTYKSLEENSGKKTKTDKRKLRDAKRNWEEQ